MEINIVERQICQGSQQREDNWIWSPPGIIDMHRPERWGYVQFTKAAAGQSRFRARPDPPRPRPADGSLPSAEIVLPAARSLGRHIARPGNDAAGREGFSGPLELMITDDGFQAMLETPVGGGATRRLFVRQDSLLWTTAPHDPLKAALDRAGKNRKRSRRRWTTTRGPREAMRFVVGNMPARDLRDLSADFLLENVRLAYRAWNDAVEERGAAGYLFQRRAPVCEHQRAAQTPGGRSSTNNLALW